MEVSIRECPECGAVVMGDEKACNACGKVLPAAAPAPAGATPSAPSGPTEHLCPKCHAKVPRGVLRCRDCGAYMSADVEAAALAKQMARGYVGTPSFTGGFMNPSGFPAGSTFAEVADDADFDLNPGVEMIDDAMQAMVDQQSYGGRSPTAAGLVDDDFELGDGTGAAAYEVADEPSADSLPADIPLATGAGAPTEDQATAPESTAPTTAEGEPPAAEGTTPAGEEGNVPHSVQTGGDVLLDAALEEERDSTLRQKGGRRRLKRSAATALTPDRFLVFCPNGHRIQVHTKHRGRTGRCPNCKALFFVPNTEADPTQGETAGDAAGAAAEPAIQPPGYSRWITDVRLHRLNPAKLKLKAGSLAGEFEPVDLGAGADHLLLAVLFTGGGPFRAMQESKKKAATRQEMLNHLAANMPLADVPVPKHYVLTPEQLQLLKIAQPTVPGEESLFADIPVFGEGRIALRLPPADAAGERAYLSFTLSQFREYSAILSESYGLTDFGAGTEIPMTDDFQEATCHYSESTLRSLPIKDLPYYRADPALKLVPIGRRCEKCGLVVSEDSRKKEKIGGSSDSSVARAKCPKCKQKFGNITLFGFGS